MKEPTLKYYACGSVEQEISELFSNQGKGKRIFPAGVFLYQDEKGNRVLFDTGISPNISKAGIKGAVWSKMMLPKVAESETIEQQLIKDHIDPKTIGHVVLSHFHPDHISGISYFPNSTFVFSEEANKAIADKKMRDLIIPGLLPDWFDDAKKIVISNEELSRSHDLLNGHDLFDDGNFILTDLPGHAKGQIGALVLSRVLLSADASWGHDLLDSTDKLRIMPKIVSHNMQAYLDTTNKVLKLKENGVAVHFSHDKPENDIIIP